MEVQFRDDTNGPSLASMVDAQRINKKGVKCTKMRCACVLYVIQNIYYIIHHHICEYYFQTEKGYLAGIQENTVDKICDNIH